MKTKHVCTILIIYTVIFSFAATFCGCGYYDKEEINGVVKEKWVKRINDSDAYLISVEKNNGSTEVISVSDEPIMGIWNAGDLWANITVGHKYKFTVFGVRNPYFSMYRIISKMEEIK
jgi:hypothetical protein